MKKIGRVLILTLICGIIVVAIITSTTKTTPISEKIWYDGMTMGDTNAKNYFVVYTDLMCPYCNLYANEVYKNEKEFEQYLADNSILYEVRVTDMLYEGNGVEESRPAAEGAYCANREGKFWDYYHATLEAIEKDYYSRGIGDSKTSPKITDITREYWKKIAHSVGLGESFDTCYDNKETVAEISERTYKASTALESGLPTFAFNKFVSGGYDPTWDFDTIKEMYDAGLKSH